MEAKVVTKHIRISPKKLKLVADLVRGKKLDDAYTTLSMVIAKGAGIVRKSLQSVAANARQKDREARDLYIKKICVDEGMTWKRIMPAAMGRANRIRKRTSHLTVVLENRPKKVVAPADGGADAKKAARKTAVKKAPAKKVAPKKAAAKKTTTTKSAPKKATMAQGE
jgi:large subunit ribosomal protein L22